MTSARSLEIQKKEAVAVEIEACRRKEGFMLVLNIQSSPRGAKFASIAVTNAFLAAYKALHSDATIDTMNVWEEDLPDFDREAIGAKYKGINKEPMDRVEAAVWDKIQELARRFQNRIASCWAFPCGISLTPTSSSN